MTTSEPILVTGGSGFIGGHCVRRLLEQGHQVRTTVRSLQVAPRVRAQVGADDDALEFAVADLQSDDGWAEAVADCRSVLHVASPIPHGRPTDERDVVEPAREGTLRVLRAARAAGVSRVVLTSAFHAIGFGWTRAQRRVKVFTEADWSPLHGPGMDAYGRSKVLAERAAWDFVADGGPELVVLNPVAVLGPVLGAGTAVSGANDIVRRILIGALPGYPDLWIPIVDVRDVAQAHVAALTTPAAAGRRLLLSGQGGLTLRGIGELLRAELGESARRVPTRTVPDLVIRLAGLVNPEFRSVATDLGMVKQIDGSAARRTLGWEPRGLRSTVLDAARSLLDHGLVDQATVA